MQLKLICLLIFLHLNFPSNYFLWSSNDKCTHKVQNLLNNTLLDHFLLVVKSCGCLNFDRRFLAKYPENPSPDQRIEISLDEVAKDLSK